MFFKCKNIPDLDVNTNNILSKRYFLKDSNCVVVENSWDDVAKRVAKYTASAESAFCAHNISKYEDIFYESILSRRFIPNTPTLVNANKTNAQLAACYGLDINDSMSSIMDTLKSQALVQRSGGGTGINFSKIRERGAAISTTGMRSAGVIPIIKLMDFMMSEFITQGGVRQGANIALLADNHPDIEEFITFKKKDGSCRSFNVSVVITDVFMNAVVNDLKWDLVSPHTKRITKTLQARQLYNLIVKYAWETGDPGLVFIDTANKYNPTPHIGRLEVVNPCSELWLLYNEACTLGHCVLPAYFKGDKLERHWRDNIDWHLYAKDIANGIRFLDNIIEINNYPCKEFEVMHRMTNRKVGLGIIGFSDLLIRLNVPYASEKARQIGEELQKFHSNTADIASHQLAKERGSFNAFKGSELEKRWTAMRNANRSTIAPTGSTAIIARSSPSIEPNFAFRLKRNQAGMTMYETHPLFEEFLNSEFPSIAKYINDYYDEFGTIKGCELVSEEMQNIFAQANDIGTSDHILMQASFQKWCDTSISKTCNMPESASEQDVSDTFMLAWKNGCKGVTVYRNNSRNNQALNVSMSTAAPINIKYTSTDPNVTKNTYTLCPECSSVTQTSGKCKSCANCGWSICSTL